MEEVQGVADAAGRGILGTWLHRAVEGMFGFQQVISSQRETENRVIWGIVCLGRLHSSRGRGSAGCDAGVPLRRVEASAENRALCISGEFVDTPGMQCGKCTEMLLGATRDERGRESVMPVPAHAAVLLL